MSDLSTLIRDTMDVDTQCADPLTKAHRKWLVRCILHHEGLVYFAFSACLRNHVLTDHEIDLVSQWCASRNIVIEPQEDVEEPDEARFEKRKRFLDANKAIIDGFILAVQDNNNGYGNIYRVARQNLVVIMKQLAIECDGAQEVFFMCSFKVEFNNVFKVNDKPIHREPVTDAQRDMIHNFSFLVFGKHYPDYIPFI